MAGLYPNTPFTDGSVFTPDLADLAMEAPIFDDQTQYKGHRVRILDSELSNTAGQIKQRVSAITDALKCSVVSGLTVGYASGVVRLPNGNLVTITAGQIVVPNNSTSTIFVNNLGVVTVATSPDVIRTGLARVTTVSGTITLLEDLRDLGVRNVSPMASSIKSFGGTITTDKVCTNGETLADGFYYFRNFDVPAGISITISRHARIFCSGNVTIAGTVTVTTLANGARGFSNTVGFGNSGGLPGTGIGAGSGTSASNPYPYSAQPYGSGGGLGIAAGSNGSVTFGNGGDGGGCLWVEAAGVITVSGTILARGSNAGANSITGSNILCSGAGGGSGGLIYLSSLISITCTGTSILSVLGGNGSNGERLGTSVQADGGGGGSGGWIVLASPSNNTTGAAIGLAGGSPGNTLTGTAGTGGGTGGSFGGSGGTSATSGGLGRFLSLTFVPLGS